MKQPLSKLPTVGERKMSITNAAIKKLITTINTAITAAGISQYERNKEVWKARVTINWGHTKYKTFAGFVREELIIDNKIASTYVYHHNAVHRLGFTDKDVHTILQHMSYGVFIAACLKQKRKIQPQAFIKKYKDFVSSGTKLVSKKVHDPKADRAYGFSLPWEYADILDAILLQHGMTTNDEETRRYNVRGAVMSYLDSLN